MRMEYDPSLIEKSVRLAARRDAEVERALHRQTDPIYRMADAEARDRGFAEVFTTWFQQLKLEAPLAALVGERSLIGERCQRCILHEAARRSDESVELFVRQQEDGSAARTLIMQVLPESVVSPERVSPLFRRELLHVSDMLCERFGFRADDLASLPQPEQMVRDRYRVLWDLYVESRLLREGRISDRGFAFLRHMFERAFTHRGERPPPAAFEAALAIGEATHALLLDLARRPERLSGKPSNTGGGASAGCPLCGFPTFDWFDFSSDDSGKRATIIRRARPEWNQAAGACRQCVETYLSFRQEVVPC